MTWTDYERRELARAVLGAWPAAASTLGPRGIVAYLQRLEARRLTPGDVLRAIDTWPAGSDFPPSAPNLAGAALHDPSAPTAEEAVRLIFGRGGVLRARPARGAEFDNEAQRLRALDRARTERAFELHPLLGAFVERFGADRLAALPVDDPEYGELRLRDVREAWARHCETFKDRKVAERASPAGHRGLSRLDPLAALGSGTTAGTRGAVPGRLALSSSTQPKGAA